MAYLQLTNDIKKSIYFNETFLQNIATWNLLKIEFSCNGQGLRKALFESRIILKVLYITHKFETGYRV